MVYIDVYCICSYIIYRYYCVYACMYVCMYACMYVCIYLYVCIYIYIHKIGIGIVLPYWIFYRLPSTFRPDNNIQFLKVFFSESLWRAAIRRSSRRKRFHTVLYGWIMNSFLNFRWTHQIFSIASKHLQSNGVWSQKETRIWKIWKNHAATLQPPVHQYLPAMKIDVIHLSSAQILIFAHKDRFLHRQDWSGTRDRGSLQP